jgi:hypothetical protein
MRYCVTRVHRSLDNDPKLEFFVRGVAQSDDYLPLRCCGWPLPPPPPVVTTE